MQLEVKDIIILAELAIIVFMFLSSRNDISPDALKNLFGVSIDLLKGYADKTPSKLDDSILDFADNLVNPSNDIDETRETTEVKQIKVIKKDKE